MHIGFEISLNHFPFYFFQRIILVRKYDAEIVFRVVGDFCKMV